MLKKLMFPVMLLAIAVAPFASAAPAVRLTKRQQTELNESIVPAYELGDPTQLLEKLSEFVVKLDDARLSATDDLLAGQDLPTVGQMLADARLTMVDQGRAAELPAPHPRELLVLLREFKSRIDDVLSAQDKHPLMSDPLPRIEQLGEYQKLFWETHVLDNRLANAERIAQYADELTKLGSKRLNPRSIDEAGRQLIETNFGGIVADIARRRQELEEREIELRMYRIADAESILADSQNARDRFLAAYVLDLDGYLIADFFKQRGSDEQNAFLRQEIADPELPKIIAETVERGRQSAGDLVEKTQLLYTGLHWWMRGRYGAGPDAFGLLKSRMALASEETQFPLYMPQVTPQPTDPTSDAAKIPNVDRRHHYTWASEYRPIKTSGGSDSNSSSTRSFTGEKTTTHMSKFY